MSKLYYLCEVIGDGDIDGPNGAFRSALSDFKIDTGVSASTTNEVDVANNRALVVLATLDHASAKTYTPVVRPSAIPDALPDFPLDAKVNAMDANAKGLMVAAMAKHGFGTTQELNSIVSQADGYRDIIDFLGGAINPNFNVDGFDVSDV